MEPSSLGSRALLLFSVPLLLLELPGCGASRGWVTAQLTPLAGRVSQVEARLGQTATTADRALAEADKVWEALNHLRVERRLVLDLKEGAQFALNSAALPEGAKQALDSFLSDLPNTPALLFLVAGHTDSTGPPDYNYALGQQRAVSVARYLIASKGLDPLRVRAVSYGESAPVAANTTRAGRQKNRRIEVRVYTEAITPGERTRAAR